jgi:O-antigen/teichoic acid export membrane protein
VILVELARNSFAKNDELKMQRFSTQVAWTFVTRIVMIASSVGAGVIVAHWLGAEGLGALAVLNVTVAVALQIGSAGLPSANTYFIARDKTSVGPVWANALLFGIVAGTVLAMGVVLLSRSSPSLFGNIPVALIAIAAASIPFQLVSLLGLNVFLGMNRIIHFNVLDAVAQSFGLINAVIALVILGAGLRLLVSLNTAASIVIGIIVVWTVVRMIKAVRGSQRFRPDAALFKSMATYGIKFHIAAVAGMLIIRADLLIVNHYRGAGEAGVYAVASQVGMMLMLLPSVISTLIFPRISSEQDARGEFAMRATRHTAFVMLIICAIAAPVGFALPLVYGAPFNDAPLQLLILLPGIYLISIESVLVQHFSSLGLPVAIPIFWLITLAANATLNLLFVPAYGARGAAIVSSASYALIFILVALYFRAKTGNRFSDIVLLQKDEFRKLVRLKTKLNRV